MKFGYFDDARSEYVITTPETPYPWINYLGCQDLFSMISNTGAGYCFYKDARLRRILRYRYNNIPADSTGRYFYINDEGTVWNPGKYPARTALDEYECRHGTGYTQIAGQKNGVRATVLQFVPMGINAEVAHITLENRSDRRKALKLFSYYEFCLWDALDDMTNFQRNYSTGEVAVDGQFIYHITEYRERRNHYAFTWCSRKPSGYDTDRESFLGLYNGLDMPQAVRAGKSNNSVASGWAPVSSQCVEVELEPGETKSITFVLGYIENPRDRKFLANKKPDFSKAAGMAELFRDDAHVMACLGGVKEHWNRLLNIYRLESGDERLNRMVNVWNQYQCMTTFNLSRSASLFESGIGRGIGFRDSNQDVLGFVHQLPDAARQRILDLAAIQSEDGSTFHQYQPLTKEGNAAIGGGFNDDPLWLILSVSAYIKETGRFDILDEPVPFCCGKQAKLLDHLEASFMHVIENKGPHGLPLIGRADWNDCLNLNCHSENPGESFQTYGTHDGRVAESVMIAGLFVYACREYKNILQKLGDGKNAQRVEQASADMVEAVNRHGWDGEWFLRAYDAQGRKVGSRECDEGKIFIESQGWCVMAGIGLSDGKAKAALDSVIKHLDTKHGIVLHQPAYTRYDSALGEISSYPPGYKENAGIFCHNNPWIACAEAELGRGDRAFEVYSRLAPAFIEDIELHRTEPYVYAQMVAGKDAPRFGEAKNSWLTGAAAWCFTSISQWILGIKPELDGLRIDPCIPRSLGSYKIHRKFRGAEYDITVQNPGGVEKGVKSVVVNGQLIEGNIVNCAEGTKNTVIVVMG